METTLYPKSPVGIPADFTKPGKSYKRQVLIASAGIISFVLLYLGLCTWFLYKSYTLFANTFTGGRDGVLSFMVAVVTGFLGVFMVKAIFLITKRTKIKDIEIKAQEEPRLFEFIYKIADEAKAPRPHKVFISNRVNASVFYDISFVNLFFPTRKNLEIGLGLVNTLNLGEFKSILAHEFGHFTQRSMIIGRWVYVAHNVAYQIIARRDGFDDFLRTLSGIDFRIAWIGWLLSVLVWSIRAVSETFFKVVVITARALSQEMEFNADLVAVSLTGSDALIHSLYKLHAADEAYDEAIGFVNKQLRNKKKVSDIFVIQSHYIQRMAKVLNNPGYGRTPEIKGTDGSKFRVFKEQIAQPPKMWSTHPSNIDREKNAKAIYIRSEEDSRDSWILFKNADMLKQEVTMMLYEDLKIKATLLSKEEGLELHNEEFRRSFLFPAFRGIYFNRPITLAYKTVEVMYDRSIDASGLPEHFKALYPESLQQDLDHLKNLEEELVMLEGLHKKELDANDEKINYRGKEISRKELPETIEQTRKEANTARKVLEEYDRLCRNVHYEAAKTIGHGWPEYLLSVATLLHFCEHSLKNTEVLNRHYLETLMVASRIRNITSSEMLPLIRAANELYDCLEGIFAKSKQIRMSGRLVDKMHGKQFEDLLEPFQLGIANSENINSWINAAQGWVGLAGEGLHTLREVALDELIHSEALVEQFSKNPTERTQAPEPVTMPESYAKFDPDFKREVTQKVDLFSRFYNAEGLWPTVGRLASAAAIIIFVICFSFNLGRSAVVIYNGLPVDVIVDFGGRKQIVPHGDSHEIEVDEIGESPVKTVTLDGQEVERFMADVEDESKTYVYNIASAAVLYRSYAYYGYDRAPNGVEPLLIGAQRWFSDKADYYFEDPPNSIPLKTGATAIKSVMSAYLAAPEMQAMSLTDKDQLTNFVTSQALWVDASSPEILSWLYLVANTKNAREVINKRLSLHPQEVATLRQQQEMAEGIEKQKVCEQQRQLYLKNPENPDLYYLNCRCMENESDKDKAFIEGNKKWPANKWLAYAAAFSYVQKEDWKKALTNFGLLMNTAPELKSSVVEEMKRICHLLKEDKLTASMTGTPYLDYVAAVEQSTGQEAQGNLFAFKLLREGKIKEALERSIGDSSLYLDMLTLAAVSDGAPPAIIHEAVSMPLDKNISRSNFVPVMVLSMKQNRSLESFRSTVQNMTGGKDKEFFDFVAFLKEGNMLAADKLLLSMNAEMKGKCSLLGVLFAGSKAPHKWNVFASALLFDNEKPYRKNELTDWEIRTDL